MKKKEKWGIEDSGYIVEVLDYQRERINQLEADVDCLNEILKDHNETFKMQNKMIGGLIKHA